MRRIAALISLSWGSGVAATPPPAPPLEVRSGPATICAARFALRVEADETAERRGDDWWVLNAGGRQIGVRSDVPPDPGARPVTMADGRAARAMMQTSYPGNAKAGWWYWLDEPPLLFGSSFTGPIEEDALVGRVLLAAARDEACAHSR